MSSFLPPFQDISSLWPVSGVPPNLSECREDGTHPGALVGFRFCPSPEDIAQFFLPMKVSGAPMPATPIKEMDVFKYNPEDLPSKFVILILTSNNESWCLKIRDFYFVRVLCGVDRTCDLFRSFVLIDWSEIVL